VLFCTVEVGRQIARPSSVTELSLRGIYTSQEHGNMCPKRNVTYVSGHSQLSVSDRSQI
jgi:hypothetical protein